MNDTFANELSWAHTDFKTLRSRNDHAQMSPLWNANNFMIILFSQAFSCCCSLEIVSSNQIFSNHKQNTRQTDSNARKGIGRRSTSLRQTRTPPQISLELQVPSLHSPVISSLTTGNATTTPKKSNWEVIEHFNNAERGRGSVSSSLIAVNCSLSSHVHFRIRCGRTCVRCMSCKPEWFDWSLVHAFLFIRNNVRKLEWTKTNEIYVQSCNAGWCNALQYGRVWVKLFRIHVE